MRYKYVVAFLLSCIFLIMGESLVSADTLNSDWIGTLDKSYELSWHQKSEDVHNGYRTYFFLEYTYLIKGANKYPTYCIEYYKKGPRNNIEYGKTKLKDTSISKEVRDGIISIIKNGYPNVTYPFGTKDVAEAYYATSAAIHIWTMYYGVDVEAGKYLGWFLYKDGFRMNLSSLNRYIAEYSTASTASGWHIMGPNTNDSSKRTWKAAMELLKCAVGSVIESPEITIKQNKDAYIKGEHIVYEYTVISNYCTDLKVSIDQNIPGSRIEYSEEKNNSIIAKLYIPVKSVISGQSYILQATGKVAGANDIENYYYLYHTTGQYQTMVYLEHDKIRTIKSPNINVKIPVLEYSTYYDLNYSSINYIKYGDFTNMDAVSYKGNKSITSKGNVNYTSLKTIEEEHNVLKVNFNETGASNSLIISTLLNSSTDDNFKNANKELLTFSCYVKTNKATSLKLMFENSITIYEKQLSNENQWEKIDITITKSDYENNNLCIYCDTIAEIRFKQMQLESGNTESGFMIENAPTAQPLYTTHKVGDKYGALYNGVIPTRDYLKFIGWNTKKDGSGVFVSNNDVVSVGNQVLYAIWTRHDTYNIYFHYSSNGGVALVKNGVYSYNSDGYDVITVPDMTEYEINVSGYRIGYDFIGWSYENNLDQIVEDNLVDIVYVDGKDVHLYANYRKTHKLRFHYYDADAGSEQIITYKEMYSYNNNPYIGLVVMPGQNHENPVINIPRIPSYTFCGWSVRPYEKERIDYNAGDYEDATLYEDYYAVYQHSITVKFYDNVYGSNVTDYHNGSSYLHEDYKLNVGMDCNGDKLKAKIQLPEKVCEIDGYDFYGWSDTRSFSGSICYLAEESGNYIELDESVKFYALYVKKKTVMFYDYSFEEEKEHLERESYAYEYMNYNGDTYIPDMLIQSPCPIVGDWEFNGWILSEDDGKVYYPEDKFVVNDNMIFYATYKKEYTINCHSLKNDSEGNLFNDVDSYDNIVYMSSSGKMKVDPFPIPEIQTFTDSRIWTGVGYTDENNYSKTVKYYIENYYQFYDDIDLYAIYDSLITVKFHDYSVLKQNEVITEQNYNVFRTCNNSLHGVTIIIPDKLIPDVYEITWWSDLENDSESNKCFPAEELIIYNNKDYYAWHSNTVYLKCYDLVNDKVRERIFEGEVKADCKGNIIPSKFLIPEQGDNNKKVHTGYWSTTEAIVSDYWSNDNICIYEDTILNAIYKKQVVAKFNANGGLYEDSSANKSLIKYAYYNVCGTKKIPFFTPENEPYRDNYQFEYVWCDKANGIGNTYVHNVTFFSEEDITLYAVWSAATIPQLSAIDRYFFVGEEITYESIVEKIIAKDTSGSSVLDKVEIIEINNRRTDGLSRSEIKDKILSNYPRQYFVDIRLKSDDYELFDSFVIYIIDKYDDIDRLRYISEEYIDTISSESKWYYGKCYGHLFMTFNKARENAEYKVSIYKEGDECN